MPPEITQLVLAGKKIEAIKAYREWMPSASCKTRRPRSRRSRAVAEIGPRPRRPISARHRPPMCDGGQHADRLRPPLRHHRGLATQRFDGWVFVGVTSTGIYCRPSCPARTPKRENVRFYPSAAAAQAAGFRACKRCRPDATPGSPEWDRRADLVGRAMRLIADGVVDREGVTGLASRLGYTERHVHRQLVAVAGAGPLALARAQRAQTARVLLETTDVPITPIAFAAGFRSVRQFNATIREVFAPDPERAAHARAAPRPPRRTAARSSCACPTARRSTPTA